MNERIRELAEQAEQYADDTMNADPATYDTSGQMKVWQELMQEKFAELIVKMCADYADMAQDADCAYPGDYVAEAMGYGAEEGITEWRAK